MHFVYIIYSEKLDRYYIGETEDFNRRLIEHNTSFFKNSFTTITKDWVEFLKICCLDRTEARKLENFIKKMKNRSFIQRLKNEENMVLDILKKIRGA